jgi:aspartate/methionine/tyrosine aminotransferase
MDIGNTGMNGFEFCQKLLEEKGVTLSPGSNFGLEWENYVRISYACSLEDVKKAMKRLKEFIEENA